MISEVEKLDALYKLAYFDASYSFLSASEKQAKFNEFLNNELKDCPLLDESEKLIIQKTIKQREQIKMALLSLMGLYLCFTIHPILGVFVLVLLLIM